MHFHFNPISDNLIESNLDILGRLCKKRVHVVLSDGCLIGYYRGMMRNLSIIKPRYL